MHGGSAISLCLYHRCLPLFRNHSIKVATTAQKDSLLHLLVVPAPHLAYLSKRIRKEVDEVLSLGHRTDSLLHPAVLSSARLIKLRACVKNIFLKVRLGVSVWK